MLLHFLFGLSLSTKLGTFPLPSFVHKFVSNTYIHEGDLGKLNDHVRKHPLSSNLCGLLGYKDTKKCAPFYSYCELQLIQIVVALY
jgi:hypothetical protein